MPVAPGALLTLDVEKPTAGGRMLARHQGQVVLVWGAIPGERVRARIERAGKGVLYAETDEVLAPSADRRSGAADWRCGGAVLSHVTYERQLTLKAEIIGDAFGRIGRMPLSAMPRVVGSPEQGYRMRARLHVRGHRIGFFREGSHELCDAAATAQLLPATNAWIEEAARLLERDRLSGLESIEIAENAPGDERACHLELAAGVDGSPFTRLATAGPLIGLSAERHDRQGVECLAGRPAVTDIVHGRDGDPASAVRLRRDVRAFFQGNRFLLERLVQHVVSLVPAGPVVDLYAGVGLFGLVLAASGTERVTLVEGDPVSGADLERNAERLAARARVERRSVEDYLRRAAPLEGTVVVDPPRTGMSRDALQGIVLARPSRIVYVSCDVATLARDTRTLLDSDYELEALTAFDLFPNTAHVESVAAFSRAGMR